METYIDTILLLKDSILGSDFPILITAIATFVAMVVTLAMTNSIKKRTKEWRKNKNIQFSKFLFHGVGKAYTIFVALISIFPLLGMLGTVFGLLGLDMTSGDMENIKENFFVALTSTAWGIIFSVFFKVVNAFIENDIEEQIELAKQLSEEMDAD